tara:strand:+ start:7086 stop:8018 length:933 start_codon:yes stop_codon:yes gene_type:complete
MAVRSPLKYDSGNLVEMSSAEVNQIVQQIVYQYSLNPSVELSVVGSGGSLASINDTRLQAGAMSTDASAFPNEATTAEPSVVTVSYDRVNQTATGGSPTSDSGTTFPIFYNAGDIQAMTLADVKDTFLHPAIDLLAAGTTTTNQAGTYWVSASSSETGSSLVSSTPIYQDTRADTSLYTAGEIGETLDQPHTINSYYLHRINGSNTAYTTPYYINASNDIQEYTTTNFQNLMQGWIRSVAATSVQGYKLTYSIGTSGSGQTRGSGMADTRLNGTGNYQTRQVGADDYRAQEFPDGTPTTIGTYYLRINKS